MYSVFQKELCNGIPNVTVWRCVTKTFTLKGIQAMHRIHMHSYMYSVFQNGLCYGIPNVTVWRCVTKTFTLKGIQAMHRSRCLTMDSLYAFWCKRFRNTRHTVTYGIPLQSSFLNTLHYQWKSHWTVTIPGRTRRASLHYDSSKNCKSPLNKCI
jgi:hypothetical protein